MDQKKCIIWNTVTTYLESVEKYRDNTLLFLHGWMQDKDSFRDIFSILDANNISYISLDLPGFWGTGLVSSDMEIEDYGKFVIDFIEKTWLKNPTLVGHSFGGRISIYLGSFYENISKIVLIWAAGIAPEMNPIRLFVVKVWKAVLSFPWLKWLWAKVKTSVSASDYASAGKMTQIYRNTIENDLQHYMKQVALPTLMIWWDSDDQVPLQEAEITHSHMKHSQLEVLKWSHFIHQEQPIQVTDIVLNFIK